LSKKSNLFTVSGLLLLLLFAASAGATTTLYSTLGPNGEYDTGSGYFVDGANYFNQVLALPFTVGTSMNIADAVLALGNYQGNNNPINVYLMNDGGGQPGGNILDTLIQQGQIPPFSSGGGLVTFNCTTCPLLNTSTTYWIVAQEADANTEQVWMFAYLDQFGHAAFDQNGSINGPWNQFDSTIMGMRIDGGSVTTPEPTTLFLLGAGLLALGAGLRRKMGS